MDFSQNLVAPYLPLIRQGQTSTGLILLGLTVLLAGLGMVASSGPVIYPGYNVIGVDNSLWGWLRSRKAREVYNAKGKEIVDEGSKVSTKRWWPSEEMTNYIKFTLR